MIGFAANTLAILLALFMLILPIPSMDNTRLAFERPEEQFEDRGFERELARETELIAQKKGCEEIADRIRTKILQRIPPAERITTHTPTEQKPDSSRSGKKNGSAPRKQTDEDNTSREFSECLYGITRLDYPVIFNYLKAVQAAKTSQEKE